MPNNAPIFSRVGDIQGGATLLTGVIDYLGTATGSVTIMTADPINGGFVQRLRFKALGTNIPTVARIFINNGSLNQISTVPAPTGFTVQSTATTGGTLTTGTYYSKIQALDQYNGVTTATSEISGFVSGPAGVINFSWNQSAGATGYRLFVGPTTGGEYAYFTTGTTSTFAMTVPYITNQIGSPADFINNNFFYGEISLPGTTAIATAATVEIDYPMNIALPPGYRIFANLATTVASGWLVTSIGGRY